MSRETLRTQLDAMRLDVQVLQVENQKLKEQLEGGPNRELELTQQLVQAREENLRLTKQLDKVAEQLQRQQQDVNVMEQFEEQQQALGAAEGCSWCNKRQMLNWYSCRRNKQVGSQGEKASSTY